MKKFLFIALSSMVFICVSTLTAQAQGLGCKAEGEAINEVLDSRIGQSAEYSQSITLGVSFLLNDECDSALAYFNSASQIFSNDALSKLIVQLGGVVVAETHTQPSSVSNADDLANSSVESPAQETPAAEVDPVVAAVSDETSIEQESSTTVLSVPAEQAVEVESTQPVDADVLADEVASEESNGSSVSSLTFTTENLATFQAKGLEKVKRLTEYLDIISQKSTPSSMAISTVESALALFDGENHTVEVSTANRPEKSRYPVRTYFNRLRMLNYTRVVIEGASFTYVSTFRKGPDGNYYGVARFRQTFSGFRDNKPVYSDVTTKTVAVVLKPYQKAMEGESMENWDVFLGDIFVTQTEKK